MKDFKRTERGWGGHFICASRCLFRRNTLLEYKTRKIVVSTVGLMRDGLHGNGEGFSEIGYQRYYETMVFHANKKDKRYYDADVSRQINFESPWSIDKVDADDLANDMHEKVIGEITQKMVAGVKL